MAQLKAKSTVGGALIATVEDVTEAVEANKITIVNDLTTGGVDKALSAEQGKELFTNVDNGKTLVANAIIDKGQSGVSNDSTFKELADKIKAIQAGSGYGVGDVVALDDVKGFYKIGNALKGEIWSSRVHRDYVNTVAVDSQGNVFSGSDDNTVKKIDGATGQEIWRFRGHTSFVTKVAVDSQGHVFSGSGDSTVKKIDGATGQEIWSFKGTNDIYGLAVDSQGNVYSGGTSSTVKKIDGATGQEIWRFIAPEGNRIRSISTDNKGNIYVGAGAILKKIDGATGQEIWSFKGTNDIYGLAVDSQGNVYSGGTSSTVKKIDGATGQEIWSFIEYARSVIYAVVVDSQGHVYSGSGSSVNKVKKIDGVTGQEIWSLTANAKVQGLAVDSQGNVYSGPANGYVNKLGQDSTLIGYEILKVV